MGQDNGLSFLRQDSRKKRERSRFFHFQGEVSTEMAGYNQHYGGAHIYVDLSDVRERMSEMEAAMKPEQFKKLLRRTFTDAAKKVKTIVGKDVPQQYAVTAQWAKKDVGGWRATSGDMPGAVIPIKGQRGSIGGRFKVSGARGRPKKGKRYKISAKILKAQKSTLPATMEHQGGNPPFYVKSKGVVFTRKYANKARPIVRVVGLGVPQMPLNQSEEQVQEDIRKVVIKRLEHNFMVIMKLGK